MKTDSTSWLLMVVMSFSITIHNVNLLPSIVSDLVKISMVVATMLMNLIIYCYYPWKMVHERKEE